MIEVLKKFSCVLRGESVSLYDVTYSSQPFYSIRPTTAANTLDQLWLIDVTAV